MKKKNNSNNSFGIASALFTKEEVKVQNEFMVNRILSFQKGTILFSIDMNRFVSRLPSWARDTLYNLGVPKQKNAPYLKYPKRKKKQNPKLLAKISSTFCCNGYHSQQIIDILKRHKGKPPESYYGLKKGE